MRRGNWYLATAKCKGPGLNHKLPMTLHIHHGASESFWVPSALIFASVVYLRGWLRLRRYERHNVEGWRTGSFVVGVVVHLDCNSFTSGYTRSRHADGAHGSTSSSHDTCASVDLARHASKATGAWLAAPILTRERSSIATRTDVAIRKRGNSPGTLLVCSRRQPSCVACSLGVHARPAIASVA